MAKELAMVERNDKGKQIRRYFIDCEARLRTVAPEKVPSLPGASALGRLENVLVEVAREHDDRIRQLEATARPGPDWISIYAWCKAHGFAISNGEVAFLTRVAMENSGKRSLPVGREKTDRRGGERRIFCPRMLAEVLPPLLKKWEGRTPEQRAEGTAAAPRPPRGSLRPHPHHPRTAMKQEQTQPAAAPSALQVEDGAARAAALLHLLSESLAARVEKEYLDPQRGSLLSMGIVMLGDEAVKGLASLV